MNLVNKPETLYSTSNRPFLIVPTPSRVSDNKLARIEEVDKLGKKRYHPPLSSSPLECFLQTQHKPRIQKLYEIMSSAVTDQRFWQGYKITDE